MDYSKQTSAAFGNCAVVNDVAIPRVTDDLTVAGNYVDAADTRLRALLMRMRGSKIEAVMKGDTAPMPTSPSLLQQADSLRSASSSLGSLLDEIEKLV